MTTRRQCLKSALGALSALGAATARGRAAEIVVAQVACLSGPHGAELGQGLRQGAQIVFDEVNASGGIAGRPLRLLSLDDGYDADRTVALTRELLERDEPLALLNYRGTANTLALLRSGLLQAHGISLVGTLTGAPAVHGDPQVFHTRTPYATEIRQLVRAVGAIGHHDVGVLYADDAFGRAGLAAARAALAGSGRAPALEVAYQQSADVDASVSRAVTALSRASLSAVLVVAVGEVVPRFVARMRDEAPGVALFGLSVVPLRELVSRVGARKARGVGLSQVYPFPWSTRLALVREYRGLLQRHAPGAEPDYFSLEGCVNARVLVEALRRSGTRPSRASVSAALRGLGTLDLGGFTVSFDARHVGSSYTDLVVIGADGRPMR